MKNIIIDGVEYNLTQVKKEYEILSFKQDSVITDLWTYFDNEGWCRNHKGYPATYPYTLDQMLNNYTTGIAYFIHSVKRLSDGKIFTVGDKVNWVTDFIIKGFTLNGNHCYADIVNINLLSVISPPLFKTEDGKYVYENDFVFETINDEKYFKVSFTKNSIMTGKNSRRYFSTKEAAQKYIDSKRVLFCTEDGVDVFEGDIVYSVNITHYNINKNISGCTNFGNNPVFSTKESAEEFILWNKPSLSLKQIEDTVNLHWQDLEKLKEVIK